MAEETAKKQTSENQPKKKTAEETPKKSPKTQVEKSADSSKKKTSTAKKSSDTSDKKIEKPLKKTSDAAKTEPKKENASEKTTASKKADDKKATHKSDVKTLKTSDKRKTAEKDNKSAKADTDKKKIIRKSQKASEDETEEGTQYTPYKKKAKVSFKVFLFSFLIIAVFLTLNQLIFHIPGVPTWDSVFSGEPPTFSIPSGEMQVHFIDVGQGDSALIVTEDKIVLIDSGEKEYSHTVIEYVEKLGISKLDIIIGSHPHSDHIGSMFQIVDKFQVGELILPKMTKDMIPDTSCYADLIRSADKKKVKVSFVRGGEKITLSDGCSMDILAPVSDYDDLNNYSIVCKLVHGENSFLFTGDIETSAEYDIVESGADLSVDVLKVPHHGSATSSSYKFLKNVRPTYAVISVGSPNDYGHPNKTIFERYEEFDCKRYRTDMNGDIVFKSDGVELKIETENKNGYV